MKFLRNQEQWIAEYNKRMAYWNHDGNPKRPHVELRSGNHSDGFFNSRPVIEDEAILWEAAHDLAQKSIGAGVEFGAVSRVVGPQTGATKLAELLSKQFNLICGTSSCKWASPAKIGQGKDRMMVFVDEGQTVLPGEYVLLCEDVLTTGGSVELTEQAVITRKAGALFPHIAVLVNRSGLTQVGDKRIVALIDKAMPIWAPDVCPLCKVGSEALANPKEPANWARLNAQY